MRHLLVCAVTASGVALATPLAADDLIDRYYSALKIETVMQILRDEGMAAGQSMTEDGQISASPAWTAQLNRIYDIETMDAVFRSGLDDVRDLKRSEPAIAFFETELGARIVDVEIDARISLADESLEAELLSHVEALRDEDPERVELYEAFIESNGLVDSNVSGALNSNLAFYQGLATNPDFGAGMTEEFMLNSVWAQEPEIREDMENWTISFAALAYGLLSNEDLEAYIALSRSEAGQKLNSALFRAFDQVFEIHSYALGRAVADFSQGDDT